jgi:hypothetical protein
MVKKWCSFSYSKYLYCFFFHARRLCCAVLGFSSTVKKKKGWGLCYITFDEGKYHHKDTQSKAKKNAQGSFIFHACVPNHLSQKDTVRVA